MGIREEEWDDAHAFFKEHANFFNDVFDTSYITAITMMDVNDKIHLQIRVRTTDSINLLYKDFPWTRKPYFKGYPIHIEVGIFKLH